MDEFLDNNPALGMTNNGTNFIISFILIGFFVIVAMGRSINEEEKRKDPDFLKAIKNKKVLYETGVILNPKAFYLIPPDPSIMVLTEKEIIITTKPLTIIPYQEIKEVKMNPLKESSLKIYSKKGEIYKLVWASPNKAMSFNLWKTVEIKDKINQIINKKT